MYSGMGVVGGTVYITPMFTTDYINDLKLLDI
jgi:hypothetical protein